MDSGTDMSKCANGPALGVLNIDKPRGLTSHDVVARVRRLAGQRRVGHVGTLDPMATGVLVVCLGQATRIAEYLADSNKSYLATIHFGVVTDTLDTEGRVVEEHDWDRLSLGAIERVLPRFKGCIEQVPPMYSALKRRGQPLYRLARRGITVERKPRMVEIHDLDIVDWQPPELVLHIGCSKGTYIRALARDLGQAVGLGAHLSGLKRMAVGRFRLDDAVCLDTLLKESKDGLWRQHLLPLYIALADMPSTTVDRETESRIRFGQAVKLTQPPSTSPCCAYDSHHRLIAILQLDRQDDLWKPHKVLATWELDSSSRSCNNGHENSPQS